MFGMLSVTELFNFFYVILPISVLESACLFFFRIHTKGSDASCVMPVFHLLVWFCWFCLLAAHWVRVSSPLRTGLNLHTRRLWTTYDPIISCISVACILSLGLYNWSLDDARSHPLQQWVTHHWNWITWIFLKPPVTLVCDLNCKRDDRGKILYLIIMQHSTQHGHQ